MILPTMPSGVEHKLRLSILLVTDLVILPTMPSGVEHVDDPEDLPREERDPSNDAVSRGCLCFLDMRDPSNDAVRR